MKTNESLSLELKRFKLAFKISLAGLIVAFLLFLCLGRFFSTLWFGVLVGFLVGLFATLAVISVIVINKKQENQRLNLEIIKTQNLLISKDREGRIVEFFAWISLTGIVVGAIFSILYVIYENPFFGIGAISGFTTFVFPVILLQFVMSADIYPKGLGIFYLFFYFLIFPLADMWFFNGINVLFNILPNYHMVDSLTRGEIIREAWLFIGSIYLVMNGAGLIWRIGKSFFKKNKLIFLSV